MTNNELPEAPASVTYSITSKSGYNALFTIRDATGLGLLEKMATIENKLTELEYKPQIKQGFAKKEIEYVEGRTCPKDGGRLIKKVTKAGKPFLKCENGKWNPVTNQATGCPFVDWLEDPIMEATA